jgi:hypothetical protein
LQIPDVVWEGKEVLRDVVSYQNFESAESRAVLPDDAHKTACGRLANRQVNEEIDKENPRAREARLHILCAWFHPSRTVHMVHDARPQRWERKRNISPKGAYRGDCVEIFDKHLVSPEELRESHPEHLRN